MEEMGGMYSALQAGFPQETVVRTTEEKTENIKRRKDRFVGATIYPEMEYQTFDGFGAAITEQLATLFP